MSLLCRPLALAVLALLLLAGCNNGSKSETSRKSAELRTSIEASSNGEGLAAFTLPEDGDYDNIPQDSNNPITKEKVALGKLLYHETSVSTEGLTLTRNGEWSCASCHHAGAGFKAGIPQGIAEGGEDFGLKGEERVLSAGLVANSTTDTEKPDTQGIASPAILNIAYQDVMLWNGALGNNTDSINRSVNTAIVEAAGPGVILANQFELSGIETQALAGTNVHRLDFDDISGTGHIYETRYNAAYSNDEGVIPAGSSVTQTALGAAKAIAAYERTILANQAPFQKWLRGDESAMTLPQIKGALLFFGKAACVDCHKGPALSSVVGAAEDEIFFNIGFADFDPINDPQIHGTVTADFSDGRGGFTGVDGDKYKFKIPQLYNLTDAEILGHGASFRSVREVIEYKNVGNAQVDRGDNIDSRFAPLNLSSEEVTQLTDFIENGLYDHELSRYVPPSVLSGNCFPVADADAMLDLDC